MSNRFVSFMRLVYSLLWYILAPFIAVYLIRRGRKNRAYYSSWHERFGIKLKYTLKKPVIWIHAVSVGETRALSKLIALLTDKHSEYQIVLTSMTPTGRNTAKTLYPQVITHYLPYEMPHAVCYFYSTFKPSVGVIMETEIWPNLIHYGSKFNIQLYLVNARLSAKSFNAYYRVRKLITPFLNQLSSILCQDENSLGYFAQLGYTKEIKIIGNMKFDLTVNPEVYTIAKNLNANILDKKVVVFASTREKDEDLLLNNLASDPDYLLIIVPRHPERFEEVERSLKNRSICYQKRSENNLIASETQVFLGDSLGEMMMYYAMSDVVIMGGSFNNHGGQNLIEAIFMQKPTLFGKSMYNFKAIAENAVAANCAIQVKTMSECLEQVDLLLKDQLQYEKMEQSCQSFIAKHTGASTLVFETIEKHLVTTQPKPC